MEVDPEVFELLMLEDMEDPENIDPALLEYHPYQLMCYEGHSVIQSPCICHRYLMMNPHMSINSCSTSDISGLVREALGEEWEVCGPYFVASWVCGNFYQFSPVFLDKVTVGMSGMMIFVAPSKRHQFLDTVARLGELGCIPCHYLRKVDVDHANQLMVLYTERWWGVVANILYEWQGEMSEENDE
nr:MAG: hypothetical protein [Otus scops adenovirus]